MTPDPTTEMSEEPKDEIVSALNRALHSQTKLTLSYGHSKPEIIGELETQLDADISSVLGIFSEIETKLQTANSANADLKKRLDYAEETCKHHYSQMETKRKR